MKQAADGVKLVVGTDGRMFTTNNHDDNYDTIICTYVHVPFRVEFFCSGLTEIAPIAPATSDGMARKSPSGFFEAQSA